MSSSRSLEHLDVTPLPHYAIEVIELRLVESKLDFD